MNIIDLFEDAFEAGVSYGRSQTGGTIDQLYSDNGNDFHQWLFNNYQLVITSLKNAKFIHICKSNLNGHTTIKITETSDWPFSPYILKTAFDSGMVNWNVVEL